MGGLFQNNNLSVGSMNMISFTTRPTDYSSLFLWLDAADSTTITASANAISTWSDKSGGGRNFVAGGAPTYQTGSFNGLPSVNFNGSSNYLTYASNTSYNKFTIFAVMNIQNNPTMQVQDVFTKRYYWAAQTTDFPFAGIFADTTVTYLGSFVDAGGNYTIEYQATSSASTNTNYLYTSYYDQTNLISSLNGVVKQTTAANINLATISSSYSIGKAGVDFSGGAGFSYYKGNIAELIMYTSSLSADQQKNIRTYLATKWRLPFF